MDRPAFWLTLDLLINVLQHVVWTFEKMSLYAAQLRPCFKLMHILQSLRTDAV